MLNETWKLRSWAAALAIVAALGLPSGAIGQAIGDCDPPTATSVLAVNDVSAVIGNDGGLFFNRQRFSDLGYEVPKGGGVSALRGASLWLGGLVDDSLHWAGEDPYRRQQFWPGPVPDGGLAPSNYSRFDRIWQVSRNDVEAYERFGLRTTDLLEWPTGLGAPTVGSNGQLIDLSRLPLDERIERTVNLDAGERPALTGDAMAWWIMNDLGGPHVIRSLRRDTSYAKPFAVEIRGSAFAFRSAGVLSRTTFYRLRIRNRLGKPIEETYLGLQVDAGRGDGHLVGSDSVLGLAYTYHADNLDEGYYGASPPAHGLDFFRGPQVDLGGASEPEKRLGLTAFAVRVYEEFFIHTPAHNYGYMKGLWLDGIPFTFGGIGRGYSHQRTRFLFSGMPPGYWSQMDLEGDGWGYSASLGRFVASTGPFRIPVDGVQEIVFGIVTSFGEDHLDSVRQLKLDDAFVQGLVDDGLLDPPGPGESVPPAHELVAAVYPTPAVDRATIRYSLPQAMSVTVEVFDAVGRRVAVVVHPERPTGSYSDQLSVDDWAPGVYLIRFQLDHHVSTRKLVVTR